MANVTLKRQTAATIKRIASTIMVNKLEIAKLQEKVDALNSQINELNRKIETKNNVIKDELCMDYTFDDLFIITTSETVKEDGKVAKKNELSWKYPETLLPPTFETEEETQNTETEIKTETENINA